MSGARASVGQQAIAVPRLGDVVALAGTAVLVASIVGLALSESGTELATGFPAPIAVAGLIGLCAMAAASWAVRSERPLAAAGISVAMVGLAVPFWAAWDWVPAGLTPVLLAAGPMAVPGTLQVALGWPSRIVDRKPLRAVYVLAGLGTVIVAIAYDPFSEPGCALTCVRTEPIAASAIGTHGAVIMTAVLLLVAAAIAGRALLAIRRVLPLLAWAVGASLVLLVAAWTMRAWRWTESLPALAWIAPHVLAALLVGGSVLAAVLLLQRQRLAAELLIAELTDPAASVGGGRVRAVEFAIPEEGRWITADGATLPGGPADGAAIVVHDADEPAVRLWFNDDETPPALDEIGPGARVALATARLAAVTRARLSEVRESQRRIVRAADVERQRIERDLHDGAQQRLISASLHLSLASPRLPAAIVDRAQSAIGDALQHLRHLAHGIVAELPGDGLRSALERAVQEIDAPISLDVEEIPMADAVAAAIHASVTAIARLARDRHVGSVGVSLTRAGNDQVLLRIELDGVQGADDWDASVARDRIGAAGGSIMVNADSHRLIVEAELPCAS